MVKKSTISFIIFTFIAIVAIGGYTIQQQSNSENTPVPIDYDASIDNAHANNGEQGAEAEEQVPPKQEPRSLVIAAVGDIMVHIDQIIAAEVTVDGKKAYDFDPTFNEIAPYLQKADFVIGNLETTIAGEKNRGYSGYPEFNAPESLLTSLRKAGFDFVSTANNHSLDRREAGVITTIENLEKEGLLYTGTARSQEERDRPLVLERNGIKLALFSYTYGTNGIPIPNGKNYLVNLIDKEAMKQDIAKVRSEVDFVIVSMHYGHEYHRQPNTQQIEISDFLVEQGADIVLGSHPHVIQPAVWRQREHLTVEGMHEQRDAFIIYSMGNFVSAQRGDYKDNGVVVYLTLGIDEDGVANINQAEYLPTYVQKTWHQGKNLFRILAAEKSISDYEQKTDPLLREFDYTKLRQALRDTTSHLTIEEGVKTFSQIR